jgi:hypothetical protein
VSTPSFRTRTQRTSPAARPRRTSVTLAPGSTPVALQQNHVDLLVRALRAAGSGAADAVADEMSALALAGVRIDLLLTGDELQALIDALVRIDSGAQRADATFGRILSAARKQERA